MKKKKPSVNLKSLIILSAVLIILFMIAFFLSNKKSSSINKDITNQSDVKKSKQTSSKSNVPNSKSSKSNAADKNTKNSILKDKTQIVMKSSKKSPNKNIVLDKKNNKVVSKANTKKQSSISNSGKSKPIKVVRRPKTYKYSKRFLQIDQDLGDYSILKGVYYLPNTAKNRAKYPTGLIQDSFIKVKSTKNLNADSVLQNKNSKNFSLFKRVVKFQVKDEMGVNLLNDLKGFKFVDMNELSMINYKYVLKFKGPEEAFKAYSLIRSKTYLKWSSIDVFEFIKIKE